MATFSKIPLSASSGGKGVKIAAISGTGTTIHTSGASSSVVDELWLYCINTNSANTNRKLTIQYGGTVDPDDVIETYIPAESGLILVCPGLIIVGDGATGRTVRAIASAANELIIFGYVNRILP